MEKITLRLFWVFMLACAATFLLAIWIAQEPPEILMKTVATFFVIGLAQFLIWAPLLAYRFLKK